MRLSPSVLTLFAVGLVLRPQIVGVGPLLPKIESSLEISHGVAGLLTTIPVFCMGVFAPLAPPLLRRYGSRIAIGASLLGVAAFGVLRAVVPGAPLLLLLTVPVGMGIAAAGTLMPVVVKEEHPERPALGTGVYTTGINVGATMAAVAAAPLAIAIGWRGTLVLYSLLSLAAVLPWLARRHRASAPPERAPLPFRVRVAWLLVATFALQSIFYYGFIAWLADVYTERGWGETEAGALVAVLNAFALVTGVTTALVGDRAPAPHVSPPCGVRRGRRLRCRRRGCPRDLGLGGAARGLGGHAVHDRDDAPARRCRQSHGGRRNDDAHARGRLLDLGLRPRRARCGPGRVGIVHGGACPARVRLVRSAGGDAANACTDS